MTSTNMHAFDPTRNRREPNATRNETHRQDAFRTCEQGGGMLTIDPCRKYGLINPSLDEIESPTSAILATRGLDVATRAVGLYLALEACETTGEAIVKAQTVAADLGFDLECIFEALAGLEDCGALVFARVTEGGFLHVEFDIDASGYFGDDLTLPADHGGPDEWNFYEAEMVDIQEAEDEVSIVERNPKRARVFAKTNGRCFYCISAWAEDVDHMHPRCRGGGDEDANLIGACRSCNSRKRDRTVEEYRAYLAYRNRLPSIAHVRFFGEAAQ